jgi:hypothetical protein
MIRSELEHCPSRQCIRRRENRKSLLPSLSAMSQLRQLSELPDPSGGQKKALSLFGEHIGFGSGSKCKGEGIPTLGAQRKGRRAAQAERGSLRSLLAGEGECPLERLVLLLRASAHLIVRVGVVAGTRLLRNSLTTQRPDGSLPAALRHGLEELAPPWRVLVEDNKQINRRVYDL